MNQEISLDNINRYMATVLSLAANRAENMGLEKDKRELSCLCVTCHMAIVSRDELNITSIDGFLSIRDHLEPYINSYEPTIWSNDNLHQPEHIIDTLRIAAYDAWANCG